MNENELKYSTTSLVNNYENDLTIDLVNQTIQFNVCLKIKLQN